MSSNFCSSCSFPTDLHSSEHGGIIKCVCSVCRWLSKWWLVFVGVWCHSALWLWILRTPAQFMEVKRLQGCSKTLKIGIWNCKTPHHTVCWTWCSGYDCRFSGGCQFQTCGLPIFDSCFIKFVFRITGFIKLWDPSWGLRHWRSKLDYR